MLRSHGMEREAARFVATDASEDGQLKPWFHEQQMLGFNYRMTDIQAALGLSQLAQARPVPGAAARDRGALRRGVCRARACAPAAILRQRSRALGAASLHRADRFRGDRHDADRVHDAAAQAGVGSQVHYIPVYRHPYYAQRYGVRSGGRIPRPSGTIAAVSRCRFIRTLTDEDVEHVVATVRAAVGAA